MGFCEAFHKEREREREREREKKRDTETERQRHREIERIRKRLDGCGDEVGRNMTRKAERSRMRRRDAHLLRR